MRRLQLRNESSGDAEVIWTLKKTDTLHTSPFYTNSLQTHFQLKNHKPHNFVNMSFGMGTWSTDYLRQVTDHLESLIIKTAVDSLLLNSSSDIYSYLSARKKGLGKRKIVISIKD